MAAVRSLVNPTGQKFFSLWNAGLMKLIRPKHCTAQNMVHTGELMYQFRLRDTAAPCVRCRVQVVIQTIDKI